MAEAEFLIRPEAPGDEGAVFHVNEAAFGKPDEARLVDALRPSDAVLLSLVAERAGQIVGHALFTKVVLKQADGGSLTAAALGPIGVLPENQGQGIGSALIREGLARLRLSDLPFCAVLGHNDYYPRFGFETSAKYGIRCQWEVPAEVFMVQPLRPDGLEHCAGVVWYAPAFENV